MRIPSFCHLARRATRDIATLGARPPSCHRNVVPRPVRAAARSAQNVHVCGLGGDRAPHATDRQTSDRDACGGCSSRATVLVVLLNHDTVLCDIAERYVFVCDVGDRASSAVNGLDADAVRGVGDCGVGDLDVGNGVVVSPADRADGQAVAAGALSTGEDDVCAGVDGETVILVLHVGIRDRDGVRGANVEGIGVVTELVDISGRVVDGDAVECKSLSAVDGEAMHRCVFDVQVADGG